MPSPVLIGLFVVVGVYALWQRYWRRRACDALRAETAAHAATIEDCERLHREWATALEHHDIKLLRDGRPIVAFGIDETRNAEEWPEYIERGGLSGPP